MDLDLDQLAQAVLRLPVAARAELATRLLESLDAADVDEAPEDVAAAWDAELDRRDASFEADPSIGIPSSDVFERLDADNAARRASRENKG